MTTRRKKIRIGIIGCGAIGSRIAKSVKQQLKAVCKLSGLYDINHQKAFELQKSLSEKSLVKISAIDLIDSCDVMVEAINAKSTHNIILKALKAKKSVLVMSVGKLIKELDLFDIARKNNCHILVPSGALAGIDAVKAASLVKIKKITLTSRKPPEGLTNIPYLKKKGIDVSKIKKETVLFKGSVERAVTRFPLNINVAATLALGCNDLKRLIVKIITSPSFKTNSHEIEMVGDFGKLVTRTENIPCPDNPKTSYLAVLSGIQTLKQYCNKIYIGT